MALAAWIAVSVGFLTPRTANAEAGDGLRAGDMKLTPRLTLAGSYDENVFRLSSQERSDRGVAAAPILSIEPGLAIGTVDPTMVDFTLDGSVEWEQYFSENAALQAQSGLQGAGNFSAVINPRGEFSLTLADDLTYRNEPTPYPSRNSWNRLVNSAGAEVGIHPGDRILDVGLGYDFVLHRYFSDSLRDLDKHSHEFGVDLAWKFLPKTALVVDGDASLVRYESSARGFEGGRMSNVDSTPIHARAGLSGMISNRLSMRLLGGYGWGLYESGPSYQGVLGHADLSFKYGNLEMDNDLTLSYERSFSDSSIGNFFDYHRASLELRQNLLQKRLGLSLAGRFTHRDYARPQVETSDGLNVTQNADGDPVLFDDLDDNYVQTTAGVHGNVLDWWEASLEYTFEANVTSDQIDVAPGGEDLQYLRRYQRHLVMLSTTFKY